MVNAHSRQRPRSSRLIRGLGASGAALALAAAHTACAQSTAGGNAALPQAGVPETTSPPGTLQSGNDAASQLPDIVVTAQRRSENLQNVPISVTAVSGADLARNHIASLQDLAGTVPSLVVTNSVSYGLAPITIRGLGGPNGGGSLFSDEPVAVYVDGVYVAALGQSVSDFLDPQSIEVLRGPQGTLYGRNSTSGAVLLTSKRPTTHLSGDAQIAYASFDAFNASAAVGGPLVGDVLLFRAAIGRNSGGNWARNTVDDRRFGGGTSTSERLTLELRPSSAIKIDLIGDHATSYSRAATFSVASTTPTYFGPALGTLYAGNPYRTRADFDQAIKSREVQIVGPQYTRTRATDVSLLIEWDFGGAKLNSIAGYRDFALSGIQDASPLTTPPKYIGANDSVQKNRTWSEELRLSSEGGGPFKWSIGTFYFHQNTDSFVHLGGNIQAGPPVATRPVPGPPVFAGYPAGTDALFAGVQQVDSYAVFVDATYNLTDQLSVTAGARYSKDRKHATIRQSVQTIIPTVISGPILSSGACPNAISSCRDSFDDVTPRAVVNYKVARDSSLYASFSKGFNAGAFNTFGNIANPTDASNPLETASEKITSYEIGSKNEFFDHRLRINLDAFYSDYTNLQIRQAVLTGGVAVVNVPAARVKGIELESLFVPVNGLTFTLSGAYTDGKITRGSLAQLPSNVGLIARGQNAAVQIVNVAGNRLTRAPEWQGRLGVNYKYPASFGAIEMQADLRFQSSSFFSETNQDTNAFKGAAWQEVDLRIGTTLDGGKLDLAVFAKNVFDNRHVTQIAPYSGFPIAALNTPRSIGVSASAHF